MGNDNAAVYEEHLQRLRDTLEQTDAIVIGAGAGLSTSAGYTYSGERYRHYFADFIERYGFADMYSAGFYSFSKPEEFWGHWCRHIWVNRYAPVPRDTYEKLNDLVATRDYFVITTNVDHVFQRAGFAKERLFYTQGDYGLWQCSEPCHEQTYDNYEQARAMIEAQGWEIAEDGELVGPDECVGLKMTVPSELVPFCPRCGKPMSMNLRQDNTFVEDSGWHAAASRYHDFLNRHKEGRVLYLELGVGANTPVIIKYPFWRYVHDNPQATYACVNLGETYTHPSIDERSILVDGDIDSVLRDLLG